MEEMVRTSRMASAGEGAAGFYEFVMRAYHLEEAKSSICFKRHFQRGQGLRGGFVKLARQATLFFAAQGQEAGGKGGAGRLRRAFVRNVVSETHETSDFSGSIGEMDGASVQRHGCGHRA